MSVIVETKAGKIEGTKEDGINIFKGIPYAAPPVGERRWLPPALVEPWTGVRQAKSFGTIAPQYVMEVDPENELFVAITNALSLGLGQPQSEDCLYLNIWTPGIDDARRPVMVWIHGGGFQTGSGSDSIYEGSTLPKRGDVVVVTINYRLGPLGFLNLNEITGGKIPATGHEGLLDPVAALEWVRDNIATFGGDPDNVTIFGESTGGVSVGALLGLPAAKGLFHKAILQSGASSTAQTLTRAVRFAEHFLGLLGLKGSDVDALRSLTTEQLLSAAAQAMMPQPGVPPDPEIGTLSPAVDGKVLPVLPLDAVAGGSADGIPVLVGSTLDEYKLLSTMQPEIATLDETGLLEQLRIASYSWDPSSIIEAYRKIRDKRGAATNPSELFNAIKTDRVFRMPAVRLAETLQNRGQPAYNYLFTWNSPLMGGVLGACHAIDVGFLWGTYKGILSALSGTGPAADVLATNIQDAWLTFAGTGNPSCESIGKWPTYGDRRETMMLGEKCLVEEAPYDEERRAWDSVPNGVLGVD